MDGFYSVDELGLPTPWLVAAIRAENREAEAERREAEARRERAENRREVAHWQAMQRAWAEGRQVDPARPSSYLLTAEELAQRVGDLEDREMARSERCQAIRDGRLHVLDVRPDEMVPAAPPQVFGPEGEEAARTRRRSVLGLGNSIRWARKRAKEAIR